MAIRATGRSAAARAARALLLALAAACTEQPTTATAPGTASAIAGAGAGTGMGTDAGMGAGTMMRGGAAAGSASTAGGAGGAAINGGAAAGAQDGGAAGSAAHGCAADSFCESFDAMPPAQLDPARWEVVTPNCSGTGEVALDGAVAHSGGQSLRVRGAAGYCNHAFARPTALAPPLPDPLYARFFLQLDAPLGDAHVTFLALHDAVEDRDLRMGGQSRILMWNRESDDATLPELSPTGIAASVQPAAGTWLCVELMIDAAGQALRTWVDGQEVPGLVVEAEATPDIDAQWLRKSDWRPQLQDVKLGWESYGDGSNTLWFDDFAVGPERFGCAP